MQRKLVIGASNDPLEQEADRIADQVMAGPILSHINAVSPRIQRFTGHTTGKADAPASVDRVLASSGRPLESELQHDMGQRFGYDFSHVRVHTGSDAQQSARDVNAHAYTVGHNVVFGTAEFSPETHAGRRLIAHELTHVTQQSGAEGTYAGQSYDGRGLSSVNRPSPVTSVIQRAVLENDPSTAPAMICPLPPDSVTDYVLSIQFAKGSAVLSAVDKMVLAGFATEWNLSPIQPTVRVDGFSSIDGGPVTNWPLSCNRAAVVASELNAPSVGGKPGIPSGSLEFFANGETDRFSTGLEGNRTAAIHAPGVAAPTSREPSVFSWLPNNSGSTDTANCCAVCPVNLGVDCDPPNFKNGIEFTVSIRDHDPAYSYDIKRTKEAKYHRALDLPMGLTGPWQTVSAWNKPAGSDDDSHDSDECLVPQANGSVHRVFSEDRPGFTSTLSNTYNAYIQMINFVEFVRIRKSDGTTYDDPLQQDWHTKILVEKNGGTWSVNTAESEVDTGHLSSLDP
ncbi:MAG: DUF4157 domain-containing protein [Nitrospira sp.]